MNLAEACNREVIIVSRTASATEAATLMRHYHVGDLVVTETKGAGQAPVGILTDRDLVLEVLAQGVAPDSITVGDIMTAPIVGADENMQVFEALTLMRGKGVRRLPVISKEGHLVGLLAADDIVELLAEQLNGLVGLIGRQAQRERNQRP